MTIEVNQGVIQEIDNKANEYNMNRDEIIEAICRSWTAEPPNKREMALIQLERMEGDVQNLKRYVKGWVVKDDISKEDLGEWETIDSKTTDNV